MERCEATDLVAGQWLIRVHGFTPDGWAMPDEDWTTDGDIDYIIGSLVDEYGVFRGDVFRVDSDDQTTRIYTVGETGWTAVGS